MHQANIGALGSRRSSTFIPALLGAGVKVIIYAGDADWTCSWISNKREAESIEWARQSDFVARELEAYTVDGVEKGQIKTVDGLSYMRVYEAGHDLAYFRKLCSSSWQGLFSNSALMREVVSEDANSCNSCW